MDAGFLLSSLRYPRLMVPSASQLTEEAWARAVARQYGDANALFARLCDLTPDNAEAWMMRGVTQMELDDTGLAIVYLKQALSIDPSYADPYLHLGKLALAEGNLVNAMHCAEQATRLDFEYVEAWLLLSACHGLRQCHDEAANCARQALKLNPGSAQTQDLLARALQDLGGHQMTQRQYDAAILTYRNLLKLRSSDWSLHNNLGNAYLAQGDYRQAENCYRTAIALSTTVLPEALSNLGQVLQSQGKIPEAVDCYEKALEAKPDNSRFHLLYAMGLQAQGLFELAVSHCDTALQYDPGLSAALVGKADILQKQGKYQESHALLGPLVDGDRSQSAAVFVFADACAQLKQAERAITLLEGLLIISEQSPRERQQTHAALGRLYDKQGRYDQAFTHFSQANALKQGCFDPKKHEQYVSQLISTFSPDFMASASTGHNHTELPVFIVGMPRSGTSLVEQILATHPSVYGAGELDQIQRISASVSNRLGVPTPYPRCLGSVNFERLGGMGDEYIQYLRSLDANALRITDKMPHNFMHLGLIQLLFPKTRVIHISRDPLDTCLSCHFQDFSTAHSYAYDLEMLGAYYLQYEKLMRHWKKALQLPMLHIRYETLVEDQESVSRQMIEFCGLEWDERVLRFFETKRNIATPSYNQVRQPMYRKSIGRWRNYEAQLTPLIRLLDSGL